MAIPAIDLAAANPIMCGACAHVALYAQPNGLDFACPDGHAIRSSDLVLDPDETWCVMPTGMLAYVTAPAAAYALLCEARDALQFPDDAQICDPHGAYVEALAALRAGHAAGLRLPAGSVALIGEAR
jgi:hypothetical protein